MDTVGCANTRQVEQITRRFIGKFLGVTYGVHFHNTVGLADTLAAPKTGIPFLDSGVVGLGGYPFALGASGNVATQDIIFMFNKMGVEMGVDIQCLLKASHFLKEILPVVVLTSALFNAGLRGKWAYRIRIPA